MNTPEHAGVRHSTLNNAGARSLRFAKKCRWNHRIPADWDEHHFAARARQAVIDSMIRCVDTVGYSGLEDRVDSNWGRIVAGAAPSSDIRGGNQSKKERHEREQLCED